MSTAAISPLASGIASGELAVAQRVQQLQTLIESAKAVSNGALATSATTTAASAPITQGSSSDFASALQAATADDAYAANEPSIATQPGLSGAVNASYQPGLSTAPPAGGESSEYEGLIAQAAARNGVDPAVLHGLIQQESGFDPSATSGAGAQGLTQLMPGTASSLGVSNSLDPAESIEGGARYLGQLMSQFGGNTADALAAYNAGPGAVQQYGGVPPYAETQNYVSSVLGYAESYRQSHPITTTTSGGLL
ncbi:MAG TPA: lytic transglycosylase domain-containing protein [Solirubrobacteraceae bacterium]|jgi:soluble lytic murein transglycosylase-like protein|nr:lytic transglycosylase domain-containing protein [Solirubrobacteraceae bacterium]